MHLNNAAKVIVTNYKTQQSALLSLRN